MKNKVVLITGGLTGIGRSTALAFAKKGASLVLAGRAVKAGEQLLLDLRAIGAVAEFFPADVRREAEAQALVEKTIHRFGRLDVAVNNGGLEDAGTGTLRLPESYQDIFDASVLGTLLGMKHQLRAMLTRKRGCIVNVSSQLTQQGLESALIYVASRHAVEGLTKAAAAEVAALGVRVNAVVPASMQTPAPCRSASFGPNSIRSLFADETSSPADADEVARTILFLASDQAASISGEAIPAESGLRAA